MLKRRDAGMTEPENTEPENTEPGASGAEPEKKKAQPKYSVSVYIILLFAAVMLLILLSYFVQQRNSSQTINSITQQHDKFSEQALENIEELQSKNIELLEELDERDERVSELQKELAQAKKDWADDVKSVEDTMKSDYNALLLKQQATEYLLNALVSLNAKDKEAARGFIAQLEPIAGSLDEKSFAEYEKLQGLLG